MIDISDNPYTFGCRKCGSCCKAGFFVEVLPSDNIPEHLTTYDYVPQDLEPDEMKNLPMKAMRMYNQACVAFDLKKNRCSIYKKRPTVCRDFIPNCNLCQVARLRVLSPISECIHPARKFPLTTL